MSDKKGKVEGSSSVDVEWEDPVEEGGKAGAKTQDASGPLTKALGDLEDAAEDAAEGDQATPEDGLEEEAEEVGRVSRFRKGFRARMRGIKLPAVPGRAWARGRVNAVKSWAGAQPTKGFRRAVFGTVALTAVGTGIYTQRDQIGGWFEGVGEPDCVVTPKPAKGVTMPEWADEAIGDALAVAVRRSGNGFDVAAWGFGDPLAVALNGSEMTVRGKCSTDDGGEESVEMVVNVGGLEEGGVEVVRK